MTLAVGSAVGAGFNLIARRPLSVVGWGLCFYLMLFVVGALMVVTVGVAALPRMTPGTDPTLAAQQVARMLGVFWPFFILFFVVVMLAGAVIQGAVFRSVLEPDNRRFASLRLGGQEGALLLLYLVFFLAFVVMEVVTALVFIGVGLAARSIGGFGGGALAALVVLAYLFALSWVVVRFCLAAPMTFVDRRVRFFASWTATRGEGWRLYGLAWLVGVIWFGCFIAYYILNVVISLVLIGAGGAMVGFQNLGQNPGALAGLGPMLVIYIVLSVVFGSAFVGATQAIFQAPWADVYRQMRGSPDVASTFS